tara:strand:+ start:1560 stop:2456 length:897 start_codon:yes stop_codon:yes gene_type:complete
MDISIVIVNYNVKEYIISCIHSIYKHSKSNYSFEIVVVDNNSKDGSVERIKKDFPKVKLIENNYNAGFSKAVNQGSSISIGKFLFILNPDTMFVNDCLSKMLIEAGFQEEFGVIGPSLISKNGKIQQSYWRDPTVISTILSLFHLDNFNYNKNYKGEKFESIKIVDSISGGALFLPREIFTKLKGLNENLFWMEDIDFCIRLREKGYKVYYSSSIKIIHFRGKSSEKNYRVAISNQLISKIKFFRIHHSKISVKIILVCILFVSTIKSFLIFFASPFSTSYRKKMFAYLYTIRSIFNS